MVSIFSLVAYFFIPIPIICLSLSFLENIITHKIHISKKIIYLLKLKVTNNISIINLIYFYNFIILFLCIFDINKRNYNQDTNNIHDFSYRLEQRSKILRSERNLWLSSTNLILWLFLTTYLHLKLKLNKKLN